MEARRLSVCRACDGVGLFAPSNPSCNIRARRPSWIVVEKCDTCDRYSDDMDAALSLFAIAGWFQCDDGGWHILADIKSRQ